MNKQKTTIYKVISTNNLLASGSLVNEKHIFNIPKIKMNIICIRKFQIIFQGKLQLENMTTNAVQRYDLCCL